MSGADRRAVSGAVPRHAGAVCHPVPYRLVFGIPLDSGAYSAYAAHQTPSVRAEQRFRHRLAGDLRRSSAADCSCLSAGGVMAWACASALILFCISCGSCPRLHAACDPCQTVVYQKVPRAVIKEGYHEENQLCSIGFLHLAMAQAGSYNFSESQ